MEGTSGAADLEPLRGGSGEAALDPAGLAKAGRPGSRELAARSFTRVCRARAARSSEAYRSSSLRRGGDGGRSAPDSPSGAPRSRDMRCPSGSGWGEALVADPASRNRRRDPAHRALCKFCTCAAPDGRRRAAKAGRPLARETSAGGARRIGWGLGSSRWKPRRAARLGQAASVARHHPDPADDMADGINPIRRFPPSPAQAGRAASTSLERGSVDPVVVLVDCSGCRSRREAPGPSRAPTPGNRRGKRWV
jgi:hypothetical protein